MTRPPRSVADVLSTAWSLSWRNPILWIFGFFAGGGGGGGRLLASVGEPAEMSLGSLALLLVGLFALFLVFLVLATIAAGALVGGVDRAARGPRPRFRDALGDGARSFWRMLGLFLLALLLALPLIIPILPGVLLLSQERLLAGLGALLLGLLFDLVLGLVLGLTTVYAMRVVVLEGAGPLTALREGFVLFTETPGRSIGLAVVQVALAFLLVLALIVPAVLVALPFAAAGAVGDSGAVRPALVVLAVVVAPFVLLLAGWWATFTSAYWTLAWRWARPWPPPPAMPEPSPAGPAIDPLEAPGV